MRLAFICLHGCHTYINLLCPISSEYFLIQLSSSSCFFNFSSCWHCLQHPVYLWFQEYLDQNQDVLPWCINYARSPFLSVQALKESPAILSLSVYLLSCLHLLYSILYHPVAAVKSSSELLFTESIEQVLKYCFFLYVFCLIFFFFSVWATATTSSVFVLVCLDLVLWHRLGRHDSIVFDFMKLVRNIWIYYPYCTIEYVGYFGNIS